MKKTARLLFLGLAMIGLFAIVNHSLAEDPLCERPWLFWPDDYVLQDGGACECEGVPSGMAKKCKRVLFAGDCTERSCSGAVCCEEINPK